MYPGLSDLLNDLFGTHFSIHFPPTFGSLVAVSFLLAAWTLKKELLRKEKTGLLNGKAINITKGGPIDYTDIGWNFVFGLLLGSKIVLAIQSGNEFFRDPQGAILSTKGNWGAGFLFGILTAYMKYREYASEQKKGLRKETQTLFPSDRIMEFTMMAALGGLIGAKIFHLLEYWDDFIADPIGSFFSGSGLTMYGGLIVGAAAVLWFARKNGVSLLHLCDAAAPGLMLAYGSGRIGCQLAGDGDWGITNTASKPDWLSFLPDWCWSYTYPHNVVNDGIPIPGCDGRYCSELALPVFPTPLYEAIACIALFFLLWSVRQKLITPGRMFSLYLILNGFERFLIELIRVNSKYHVAGISFTQAQLISLLLILTGTAGWYFFGKKKTIA
ncbi:MAG: prolipoprotein diacylglyceryl transferase [Bacteroidota bacterium]